MQFQPENNFLNRFTTLPILLDILTKRCITLLETSHWEDKNDTYYLEKYKKNSELETLLALCFTSEHEQFHHWKVFANGVSGVCIEFNAEKLLSHVEKIDGTSFKSVSYRPIKLNQNPSLGGWPFLKRQVFKDEKEFRIIYENKKVKMTALPITIDLECIKKITLSPWMPLLESPGWKNCLWG